MTDSGLNYEHGMNQDERVCTDFACAVFFLFFLGTMAAVALFGVVKGDPVALYKPFDHQLRMCGVSPGVEGYPKLYSTKMYVAVSDSDYLDRG